MDAVGLLRYLLPVCMFKSYKLPNIIPEIELSYYPVIPPSQRVKLNSLKHAVQLIREHWDPAKMCLFEQAKILLLDRALKVIGIAEISSGGTGSILVDPKLVFAVALKAVASSLMVVHNHPSGTITPSQKDIQVTNDLVDIGNRLGVFVVDHIILTPESYYSFYLNGLIKQPDIPGKSSSR